MHVFRTVGASWLSAAVRPRLVAVVVLSGGIFSQRSKTVKMWLAGAR
jgi:hypothetical protein